MSARGKVPTSPVQDSSSTAGSSPHAPSGDQWLITHGEQRAVIVEVGGGLRCYSAGGHDLLDGYLADEICSSGRGQVLIPWPNRVRDGRYAFGGRDHQLPLTEPEQSNAIHGLVRWTPFTVRALEADRVVVGHFLHPQPGYPFFLDLSIEYRLSARGLSVKTTAHNVGLEPCPFGSGAHPYLSAGTGVVDDLLLRAPGATVLLSDERGIPDGEQSVEGTEYDFRSPRRIGSTILDHCFTDLERDEDGLARVVLATPDQGGRMTLWVDQAYPHLMLFTGDPLPDVNRRSLAVEPMTCPPDALRSGAELITLQPGGSWAGEWGITPQGPDQIHSGRTAVSA